MLQKNKSERMPAANDQKMIRLQSGDKALLITAEQAYTMAHALLRTRRYEAAVKLLEAVASTGQANPRVNILLACCKAGMKDYTGCNELLHKVLDTDNETVAESLQAAFIFDRVGMKKDAIRELLQVADDHPELPTVCLLLGDLMAAIGNEKNAAKCWRLAAKRDQERGFVAQAAKNSLSKLLDKDHTPDDTSERQRCADREKSE
jgi:tetratricopeptide (TPR) repeat protein